MPQNPTRTGGRRCRNDPASKGLPSAMQINTNKQLWKHVGELATSSALLLYLSQVATDRLSLTQAAFFMLAATADAAGRPATRTVLIETHMEGGRASIRNSYRQLLEPSRVYPQALGWLTAEENPDDAREQILRLSETGRKVVEGALLTLEPLVSGTPLPEKMASLTN